MKRTPYQKMIGRMIAKIEVTHVGSTLAFLDEKGKVICLVSADHLFDKDGFRFNMEGIEG